MIAKIINELGRFWLFVTEKDGLWHPHGLGEMRRWNGTGWNVRSMTPQEAQDEWNLTQW